MTRTAAMLLAVLGAAFAVEAQVPVSSPANKHNLSATASGTVRATALTEICVFCHTPHDANPAAPLWNHAIGSGVTYQPYTSTTMAATANMPTGSSKLCLSCHDGTVAVGQTMTNGSVSFTGTDANGRLTGAAVVGSNLTDDHPIAFVPVTGAQVVNPPAGDPVKLDADGRLQCRSCHDPHQQERDPIVKKFLVKTNDSSALCSTCHQKAYWATNPSSHRTSSKTYTAAQGAHTGYGTVATNGCESCHRPHSATAAARTLKGPEEVTCGTAAGGQCHGSSGVARSNIVAEFSKTYTHPTFSVTPSVHDAAEAPGNASRRLPETSAAAARHAECPDCHNPHASYAATASAPKGSGKVAGVWGIDSNGSLVQPSGTPASVREYEICYKCHGDSANKPQASGSPAAPYPNRQANQFNVRLEFDPANPSYHPVEAPGRSTWVPSLKAPWTTSSVILCTDCHGSDTGPAAYPTPGTGPNGPHGSRYKHLLVARYEMDNGTYAPESAAVYALCYKCHDRTNLLSDVSFEHRIHLAGADVECAVCHDPHGVSATQGNSTNNAHLVNFDLRFVAPSARGILRYDSLGRGSGRCYLTCHGKNHDPFCYNPVCQ